jgi:hypothetical protein
MKALFNPMRYNRLDKAIMNPVIKEAYFNLGSLQAITK